ncbi:MAG: lamin tail domain-containing protein, partial [Verrucomicrobia bacterium]|nr:lamin tail domain-containing protein [Verrucomicrobiota bacterium]
MNTVEYGFQVIDHSIGLSGGQWRLLASATPGVANAAPAALGTNAALRINEWMANPASGPDWFELFNSTNLPVELGGLYLTDDPSTVGQRQFRVAPLSFIGPSGFVQWIADNNADAGRDHVNFSLDASGESLWLFRSTNGTNLTLIDSVAFDTQQRNVSEGRLPDGAANVVAFLGSATPAESNYLPIPGVVINEILTHTDAPLEDAVELRNTGASALNLGGWYLSDS